MKIKKEQRQKQQNRKYKTLIRNSFKEVEKAASNKSSVDQTNKYLETTSRQAQRIVDKAARKGLIHKKNASRKVKRIFNVVNLSKTKASS